MYKKILVPLDGSAQAEAVLSHVEELVKCTGAQIDLLLVINTPHYDFLLDDAGLSKRLAGTLEEEACHYLDRIAGKLTGKGLKVCAEAISGSGPIAEAILKYAREANIDLIALSVGKRSGMDGMIASRVVDQVLKHADMPVLVTRN